MEVGKVRISDVGVGARIRITDVLLDNNNINFRPTAAAWCCETGIFLLAFPRESHGFDTWILSLYYRLYYLLRV